MEGFRPLGWEGSSGVPRPSVLTVSTLLARESAAAALPVLWLERLEVARPRSWRRRRPMRGREVLMAVGAVVAERERCLWAARREEMVEPRESRREGERGRAFGGEAGGGFGGDLVGEGEGLREISWRGREGARRVWEESSREMSSVCGVSLLSSFGVSVLS
jgi:hypothetical protein